VGKRDEIYRRIWEKQPIRASSAGGKTGREKARRKGIQRESRFPRSTKGQEGKKNLWSFYQDLLASPLGIGKTALQHAGWGKGIKEEGEQDRY